VLRDRPPRASTPGHMNRCLLAARQQLQTTSTGCHRGQPEATRRRQCRQIITPLSDASAAPFHNACVHFHIPLRQRRSKPVGTGFVAAQARTGDRTSWPTFTSVDANLWPRYNDRPPWPANRRNLTVARPILWRPPGPRPRARLAPAALQRPGPESLVVNLVAGRPGTQTTPAAMPVGRGCGSAVFGGVAAWSAPRTSPSREADVPDRCHPIPCSPARFSYHATRAARWPSGALAAESPLLLAWAAPPRLVGPAPTTTGRGCRHPGPRAAGRGPGPRGGHRAAPPPLAAATLRLRPATTHRGTNVPCVSRSSRRAPPCRPPHRRSPDRSGSVRTLTTHRTRGEGRRPLMAEARRRPSSSPTKDIGGWSLTAANARPRAPGPRGIEVIMVDPARPYRLGCPAGSDTVAARPVQLVADITAMPPRLTLVRRGVRTRGPARPPGQPVRVATVAE